MKNSLIFMISICCFLTLYAVTPSNAYSANLFDDVIRGGKSVDEFVDDLDRSRLKGIDTVNIVIEGMSDSVVRELGINKENIRTAVEIRIRKAGIKVNEKKFDAWFYVNVGITSPINRLYGFAVSVKVKEFVSLTRDPKIIFQSTTWEKEIFGISGELKVKEGVKVNVEELVDEYILDYLKAKQN
jgi:hypothetical protein